MRSGIARSAVYCLACYAGQTAAMLYIRSKGRWLPKLPRAGAGMFQATFLLTAAKNAK